ncbi:MULTISPECIES: choice-of-anchor M domain-containing protein [Actinosynnema]|uniref:choice-of-anchor M domain-containing protein n=1 Tax=Actinosynnema TaxID=40566 RepID=UPI0020A537A0|nr:choice-of-anchor M domain-containing protein [Actinosynnema pretiosum]MCP2098561.1 surface-anchored protein [Actinosynnema pretiosum]
MSQLEARRPSRLISLLAGLVGAGLLLGSAPALAADYDPAEGRELLGAGAHVDALYPQVVDGKLQVKALTPGGVTDPERVALHVPETETSRVKLPAGYDFLGPEGTEAWVTTEAQDSSVVWPGWSFEGIDRGVLKGTVKISYTGFGYAGSSAEPRFAVTQPGGFDRTKVSKVFVPGTTFTSTTGEVGGHTHATWSFTAKGTYDIGFKVSATLLDGTAISDDATVRFIVGAPSDTTAEPTPRTDPPATDGITKLTAVPNKVDAEYFVGQTVTLTALSPQADQKGAYRWSTTAPGSSTPVVDPKQTTATFTTKPNRALDGTVVRVARLAEDGSVLEESDPLEIHVQAIPPTTTLTAKADKAEHAVGDIAKFTSAQDPKTEDEHYHWYLKKRGEAAYAWIPESRLADQELPITADLDGAYVTARLFNADHSVLSESEPLELKVTGGAAAAAELASDKDSYRAGETATFTLSGVDGATSVEWSARSNGENDFLPIEGASGTTFSRALDRSWDGSQVRAVVRDAGGAVLAEADVPLVRVQEPEPAPEVAAESGGVPTGYLIGGAVLLVVVIAGIGLAVRGRRSSKA